MATYFEVRIADEERTYAVQAAQAALDLLDRLESQLSRFRPNSDIAQLARLEPGEKMRLSEPAFACIEVGKKMELATGGAFCLTSAALRTQASLPQWSLLSQELSVRCRAAGWNSIWAPLARGLRSTAWRICCVDGIVSRSCWSREEAASSRVIRRKMLAVGPAGWATTMLRNDSFSSMLR